MAVERRATEERRGEEAPRRDAALTRQRILDAARGEFSQHGYSGGRMDRIARAAGANVQMIYRYFGGKDDLYLAVLEDTYGRIRALERQLDLAAHPPVEGMRRLVEFTFDYLVENADFVPIIRNENVAGGRFAKRSKVVPNTTPPLVAAIKDLLERGGAAGAFRAGVDPMQLYVTVLALCFTHLSNRHTLSVMFQHDLGDPEWLAQRRRHVVEVVCAYLIKGPSEGRDQERHHQPALP